MISSTSLAHSYGGTRALQPLTIELRPGQSVVLLGANGSGKSTLLRCLAGLLRPTEGEVYLEGVNLQSMPLRARARRIGFLAQLHEIPPQITVREFVERGRVPHQILAWAPGEADHRAVDRALKRVDLVAKVEWSIERLSGGERQRAWIALALAQETDFLLLDEPLAHLDLRHQWELLEVLGELTRESGKTLITALHELSPAAALADRILALREGSLVADGPPESVLSPGGTLAIYGIESMVFPQQSTIKRPCHSIYCSGGTQ